jgi:hypothetical protein
MGDERLLTTVNLLHGLAIYCPASKSTPTTPLQTTNPIGGFSGLMERISHQPDAVLDVQTVAKGDNDKTTFEWTELSSMFQ